MKTIKQRREEMARLKSRLDFITELTSKIERQRGHCTSLEINGRTMLIDIPQGKDARRVVAQSIPKNSIAKMKDKDFSELMGFPS